ncbi:MAG: NitT/TauT family transport system ATP-binding protein, partial [Pseudohongiellaceae bacterium]
MSTFIELDRISKHYGENVVLENLNAKVTEGEFVTLVGASGCGKSTFLKLLLGTESASSGELLLAGQPIGREPSPERGIVFQKYSVFPHLNVRENVALGLEFERSAWLGRLFG